MYRQNQFETKEDFDLAVTVFPYFLASVTSQLPCRDFMRRLLPSCTDLSPVVKLPIRCRISVTYFVRSSPRTNGRRGRMSGERSSPRIYFRIFCVSRNTPRCMPF